MRGEYGTKAEDGRMRPISAHSTTHLDLPYHFLEQGADLAQVLNRADWAVDRPVLARLVYLAQDAALTGAFTRDGMTYVEGVSAVVLPPVEELKGYDALVLLTGFGAVMAGHDPRDERFAFADGHGYHVPYLDASAVRVVLEAGIRLVAIDSTTVEPQTSAEPIRFDSHAHYELLGAEPPVLIVEGLNGARLREQVGYAPEEILLHVVPRRVNAVGAEAAHSRVFAYFYRDDPQGMALRQLAHAWTVEEFYG